MEGAGVGADKDTPPVSPTKKRSHDDQSVAKERRSKNPRTESYTDGGAANDTYVNDNGELVINPRGTISHPAAASFTKIDTSIKK